MKRTSQWTIATSILLTFGATAVPVEASAASNVTPTYQTSNISLNGTVTASPASFVQNGTTYMPIWYVMKALQQANIFNSWRKNVWNISTPTGITVNESQLPTVDTSKPYIAVNGIPMQNIPSVAAVDPASKQPTTFVPIWYMQQVLTRIGVQTAWDGQHWGMTLNAPTFAGNNDEIDTVVLRDDAGHTVTTGGLVANSIAYIREDSLSAFLSGAGVSSQVTSGDLSIDGTVIAGPSGDITSGGIAYVPLSVVSQFLTAHGLFPSWNGYTFQLSHQAPVTQTTNIVNPHQTYTYTQMESDIQALAKRYPNLVHTEVIGKTAYGRNIDAVSLGTGKANALITASFHAREWITTNLVMNMMDQYAQAYVKNGTIDGNHVKAILDATTLWFVPMMNPDGVTLEQSGLSAFPQSAWAGLTKMNGGSTNFTRWKANAQGIDLNRQFSAGWSSIYIDPVTTPWYEDYKGPKPYDAPEVNALVTLIQKINPQMLITYHTTGSIIYWDYKVSGPQLTVDRNYANQLAGMTGYSLVTPTANPSGGGLTDWWTGVMNRPGYTIEVGPPQSGDPIPVSDFDSIWNQNKVDGLFIATRSASLLTTHQTIHVVK